ncbi:MAG: HprK-related kinase A, partial [Janthinobacterium lividum]
GSGKSTLCAGLAMRGWRLLSDELALYDFNTGLIHGMARPINLKNASIDVIKRFAPDAVLTPPVADTIKGTVALMRPPVASVQRASEPARPAWVVLPKFVANSPARLLPHSRAATFILLAEQSFNYDIQGLRGFNAIGQLVDQVSCHTFSYSSLDEAEAVFNQLHAEHQR